MITSLIEGHVTRLATPPDPHDISRPRPPIPRPRTAVDGATNGRLYSPSLHRSSRDSSLERAGLTKMNGDRHGVPKGSHHHHRRHHARKVADYRQSPCWCEEDDYDSACEDRHFRHTYHEGIHHARVLNPRRTPNGSLRSPRRSASPCSCHRCCNDQIEASPRMALAALPYNSGGKVGSPLDDEYIPLWSCHSPLVRGTL